MLNSTPTSLWSNASSIQLDVRSFRSQPTPRSGIRKNSGLVYRNSCGFRYNSPASLLSVTLWNLHRLRRRGLILGGTGNERRWHHLDRDHDEQGPEQRHVDRHARKGIACAGTEGAGAARSAERSGQTAALTLLQQDDEDQKYRDQDQDHHHHRRHPRGYLKPEENQIRACHSDFLSD